MPLPALAQPIQGTTEQPGRLHWGKQLSKPMIAISNSAWSLSRLHMLAWFCACAPVLPAKGVLGHQIVGTPLLAEALMKAVHAEPLPLHICLMCKDTQRWASTSVWAAETLSNYWLLLAAARKAMCCPHQDAQSHTRLSLWHGSCAKTAEVLPQGERTTRDAQSGFNPCMHKWLLRQR